MIINIFITWNASQKLNLIIYVQIKCQKYLKLKYVKFAIKMGHIINVKIANYGITMFVCQNYIRIQKNVLIVLANPLTSFKHKKKNSKQKTFQVKKK